MRWLEKVFSVSCYLKTSHKICALTFDDGPHPVLTPFVLDELKKYNQKATFFLLAKNAEQYPELVKRIQEQGHQVANHGWCHLHGWEHSSQKVVGNAQKGALFLSTYYFRPPYGKLRFGAYKQLKKKHKIILWDLMSYDFHPTKTKEHLYKRLMQKTKSGSIVVFHENTKAEKKLTYLLPLYLKYLEAQKYSSVRVDSF